MTAGLRLHGLAAESLWADEIRTARLAHQPLGELARRLFVEHDLVVPLLYPIAVKLFLLVDPGEWGLRLPSAVFGVAGVAMVLVLGRALFGAREGGLAALLLAASHGHISYSREARAFTMLCFVVAALLWSTARAWRTGSTRAWIGTGVLAVAACNTHLLGVFPALASLLIGALAAARRRRPAGLIALAVPFLACSPIWLSILRAQPFLVSMSVRHESLFEPTEMARWMALLGPGGEAGFLGLALLAGLGLAATLRSDRAAALLGIVHLALPVALLQLVAFDHPLHERHLLFLLPVLVVLQARGVVWLADLAWPARGTRLAAVAGLALLALHADGWSRSFEPRRRDWRAAARAIREFAPRDVVVLSSSVSPAFPQVDPSAELLGYYLGDADGRSMPAGRLVVSSGILGQPWLDGFLCAGGRPVCALLVHGREAAPALPPEVRSRSSRGVTVLFADRPAWHGAHQAALLLIAQGWAAIHPEEKRELLRRSIRLARCADDPEPRRLLAAELEALVDGAPDRFTPHERNALTFFLRELRAAPGRP